MDTMDAPGQARLDTPKIVPLPPTTFRGQPILLASQRYSHGRGRTAAELPQTTSSFPTTPALLATAFVTAAFFASVLMSPAAAASPQSPLAIHWVAELEVPPGMLRQKRAERAKLADAASGLAGLDALSAQIRQSWPEIRETDLHALSRTQVEETRGYRLPPEPGRLNGSVIAWDAESGLWHLELLGPRLPARFDIVHRYLAFYATYDAERGELRQINATIRGWIYE